MSTAEAFHAVVLAAGAARRFGGGKLSALYRGRPLIDGALASANAAPVVEVVVVTGADPNVADLASRFPSVRPVRIVHAPRWVDGLSASLQAGVAALPPEAAGAYVFLGDMPNVPIGGLDQLARAVLTGKLAAAPIHKGVRGHPVVLGRAMFSRITQLRGDEGAQPLLGVIGDDLALIPFDNPGVLFDVDLQHDLQ